MNSRTRHILELATVGSADANSNRNVTSISKCIQTANNADDVSTPRDGFNKTQPHLSDNGSSIFNSQLGDLEPQTSYQNESNRVLRDDQDEDSLSDPSDPYQTDEDSNYSDTKMSSSESSEESVNDQAEVQEENINITNNDLTVSSEGDTVIKAKKRARNESQWKRNVIKKLRSSGQEYVNWKNKTIPQRTLKAPCINCRLKCPTKLSNDERRNIFTEYWNLGDTNRQRDYISRFVDFKKKKRTRNRSDINTSLANNAEEVSTESRRHLTFIYHLPKKTEEGTEKLKVCQKFFLNTLSVSHQIVKTVCKKTTETTFPKSDNRGTQRSTRVGSEDTKRFIREHINSFPLVDSHYCRKHSNTKYLESSLSLQKMYDLYKIWCQEKEISCASIYTYRYIFNHEYNLSFFKPKKDQCDFCLKYKNSTALEKETLQTDLEKHLENRNMSREAKIVDKDKAKNTDKFCAAVYDLQQVLPCPKSKASQCYYKRKLAVYNLTIYELGNLQGNCYMWHEATSSRGCCEIGSCVLKFIQDKVKCGVEEFSFYSDNCGGQNHNRFIYCLYMYCSTVFKIKITHNFLEKGHTQNEGDSVHSTIEHASRHVDVYVPEQWYTIARMACKKHPYRVVEMSQVDMFDIKKLLKVTTKNWEKDTNGNKVLWQKVKSLYTSPEQLYKIMFKYNYADEYLTIDTKEKCRKKLTEFQDYRLEQLHDDSIAIPKLKCDNLKSLCEQKVIPMEYHNFFKNLKATQVEYAAESDEDED